VSRCGAVTGLRPAGLAVAGGAVAVAVNAVRESFPSMESFPEIERKTLPRPKMLLDHDGAPGKPPGEPAIQVGDEGKISRAHARAAAMRSAAGRAQQQGQPEY